MVYSEQLHATHCHDEPAYTGRWFRRRATGGSGCGRVPSTSRGWRESGSSGGRPA